MRTIFAAAFFFCLVGGRLSAAAPANDLFANRMPLYSVAPAPLSSGAAMRFLARSDAATALDPASLKKSRRFTRE